ncbi:MAG: hypothetical protein WBC33_12170 [Conexibacter sp.]
MADADVATRLAAVRERHGEVLAIVAPPRTASTALARVLWNHPDVGWYSHEPFEATWYRGAGAADAAELLESPEAVAALGGRGSGRTLVVKEMTFQIGDAFPLLAALATRPIVFLVRDPRLSIASRMRVLRASNRPELFPLRESGWEDLARQLEFVRRERIEHLIVDSTHLRARPTRIAPRILERLGLSYAPELLTWGSSQATGLSSVSGGDDPFYRHVLASGGLEAPQESLPALDEFPADDGFRAHVAECVARYEALQLVY